MGSVLRISLFELTQVQRIVRRVELMSGPVAPPIISELKAAKKIFSSEHRLELVPDNALGEIQSTRLEHRRIVPEVAVTSPHLKCPARNHHPTTFTHPRHKHLDV